MKKAVFTALVMLCMTGCSVIESEVLNNISTTDFEVRGSQLYMNGLINQKTPDQLESILENNPSITEVVMLEVPGSVDDESNLRAARIIRSRGINTRLLADSEVASGGTDFFAAGVKREAAEGARFGVHSWADVDGRTGDQIPKDDTQHQLYLNYYKEMGIPAEFYWYTLTAAPAQDIHWMNNNELMEYKIITN